ncbi:MAG: small multi-drug export protein [Chthoniobacterales bacterium]
MQILAALAASFGLGVFYFVGAIPAGVALGLPLLVATAVAGIGYATGGLVVTLLGEPIQKIVRRLLRIDPEGDRSGFIYRVWDRHGLWALALLAPVTVGSQGAAVLGLALGAPRWKLTAAIAIGILPWCALFATLTALGVQVGKSEPEVAFFTLDATHPIRLFSRQF